jgi:hypothetical protein
MQPLQAYQTGQDYRHGQYQYLSRRQLQQLGGSEMAEYLNSGLIVHCRV